MSPPSILFFCALSNCSAINHPMTLRVVCFLLLWTVILNWPSSMTEFVGWRLCLIVFKTFSDRSGIRTHAHNRVPELSTEDFLESGALDRSGILPGLPRHFSVWSVLFQLRKFFNSEIYSAKRLVSSIGKDFRSNARVLSCFTCLCCVSSFLCFFKLLGYQPPNDVASRLFSFALDCHLELTFQYDRSCQLRALPHRVQNVFWQEWDSNPRTHSFTRILERGISWVCRFRPLGHPAWSTSTYFLLICVFSIGWHFQFRDVVC